MAATLEENRRRYVAAPDAAAQFLAVGAAPRTTEFPASEVAAWTLLANAVLSSDAMIVKD
jgi:hypothetical protein